MARRETLLPVSFECMCERMPAFVTDSTYCLDEFRFGVVYRRLHLLPLRVPVRQNRGKVYGPRRSGDPASKTTTARSPSA